MNLKLLLFILIGQSYGQLKGTNVTSCLSNQYYDSITMKCQPCKENQVRFNDFQCVCTGSFNISVDQIGFIQGRQGANVCNACTDCTCPQRNGIVKFNDDGSPTNNLQCVTCDSNAYLNEYQRCITCPHPAMIVNSSNQCACPNGTYIQTKDTCVLTNDPNIQTIQSAPYNLITYTATLDNINSQTMTSRTFTLLYPQAAVGCGTYNDMKYCQQLANLCLLTLDLGSTSCILFQSLQQLTTVSIPKLFYQTDGQTVLDNTQLNLLASFKVNSKPYVHNLKYYIAEYMMDGSFVGDIRPIANEMILCSTEKDDSRKMSEFGTNFDKSCTLDISQFIYNYETRFYQLFLQDVDGSLVDIPILLKDLRNTNQQQSNKQQDSSYWIFAYRFFMVDNQAGISGRNAFPDFIRFASQVVFNLYIKNDENDKIYLPYVTISYQYKQVTQIQGVGTITNPSVNVYFSVQHTYDPSQFWIVCSALFAVANVIIGVIWLVRMWIWSKWNPYYVAPETWSVIFVVQAIQVLIDTWAEGMFYFLFGVTGYWFIFFKFQQSIYVLMPSFDLYVQNYRPYEALFYTMFACRLLSTINLVYSQGELEVFFVDWEKTEITRPALLNQELKPNIKAEIDKYKSRTSVWRTLLIANEFNELQTYRVVSIVWTLLFLGFFLEGLNWKNLAVLTPSMSLVYSDAQNYVLRYFICSFLFLVIGLVQIIIRKLFDIWFPIAIEDFVDLCSIANISLVIIDNTLHGYYIHGENPIGVSEGSTDHLSKCLRHEALGKGKKRGFIQVINQDNIYDENLQTFEIFLSQRFRESYDKVFTIPVRSLTDNANSQMAYQNANILRNPLPTNMDLHKFELNRQQMQMYLKDVLTQIRSNHAQYVRNKLPIQRFFNYPPRELENLEFKDQSLPIFFRDFDYSFKNIFFCGNEYYLLISDICIFNFWLMITNSVFWSILLTYLIVEGFSNWRKWLGERNLSDKSKIDQRFLI